MLGRFQRARRKVLSRQTPYRAMLGDANNNPLAGDGMYWVRPYGAADANNIATPGAAYRVRAGSALIVPRGGRVVWVGLGYDQRLTVLGYDHDDLIAAKINPTAVQPNDPYREWIRLKNIQNFRALPIATGTTPSMKVQVRQLFYYTPEGDMVRWNGTNADAHIDLTAYVPAEGLQRYVVLWLRSYNPNTLDDIQVTASSTISSLDDVLSFDELQECADASDADTIPIGAFRLANAQTTLKMDDTIDVDLRQFINMPQVYGFPNTVTRAYRIHEDFSVVAPSAIVIEDGGLVQIQDNALLVILSEDSSGEGGGSAGMTSFIVAGDSGTPQTMNDGNTLMLAGGAGIDTAASNTDTLTISIDSTVATLTGTQAITNKTITASSLIATALSLIIGGFRGIFTHANSADRTYTLPNYDGTLATLTGTEAFANKTINSSSIGVTTAAAGYFSALRLLIGGFFGIFTHANSADRTYTLPNKNGTVAMLSDIPGVTVIWQAFLTPGSDTWTKPAGAFEVEVICISGGGQGGGGRQGAAASNRFGGGGGAAGTANRMIYAASMLSATETLVVGARGDTGSSNGAAAVNTNGGPGNPGGDSFFGGTTAANAIQMATGGLGGAGGTGGPAPAGGVGNIALGPQFQFYGSSGAPGGATVPGGDASVPAYGPGGGGGGGGIDAGNVARGGGDGASAAGAAFRPTTTGGGGVGGAGTTGGVAPDTPVTDGTGTGIFGGGGGGGGGGVTLKGGAGLQPGGGGGGGGGSLNGNAGGSGGTGGHGAVYVISYCYT